MELQENDRINTLLDFYGKLLTDKQQSYINMYYVEDFSLGEISEQAGVSRQAVYDNIKRSEKILTDYEEKLGMAENFEKQEHSIQELADYAKKQYPNDDKLRDLIKNIDSNE